LFCSFATTDNITEHHLLAHVCDDALLRLSLPPHSRRRKQAKPVRRPTADDRALALSSDSEDVQQQAGPHSNNSALASLLQGLSRAAAAGGGGAASAAAAGAGGSGGFASGVLAGALQEMEALVAEDVARLQQQWQQQELPKLQSGAAEIWQE
jgi:hypothetical protein